MSDSVSFLVHLLLKGLQRSSGVLFLATREWLGCSRKSASIPFTLNRIVSTAVEVAFSFQKDHPHLQLGCFLSSVGVALCFLATDVLWQTVFWGLIFGIGIGIATSSIVSLLTKKADGTILSSLRTVGPNIGCIILPFLLNELIFHYGLNGSYLILSGIILNCLPFICITTYEIKFNWLNTKWSLRKRSKRYRISKKDNKVDSVSFYIYKQRDIKAFCNQSFTQNLEPDALEKVSESDGSPSIECTDILKPIIEAKIKMAEQQVCDREPFGLAKISQEVKNCYEEEFRSEKPPSNAHIENNCKKDSGLLEKDLSGLENESDCTNVLDNINSKGEEVNNGAASDSSTEQSEEIGEEKTSEMDKVASEKADSPPVIATINKTFHVKKEVSPPLKKHGTNFPLEIKVHVVECTITTTEECSNFLSKQEPTVNRNGYRRHSNSLITASFENIDFAQLLNNKSSPLQKQQWNTASRMYLISEEDEECPAFQRTVSECREVEVQTDGNSSSKVKDLVQALRALARPSCLAIVYASVVYEFSLAVLLTIFGDFAKDTGDASVTSNIVLVSFGVGGVVGQLSFTQWGSRFLVDGSHAAAAVIFMLNGLAVAGVLWSINIAWLSGFYALLGFLESGVTKILPRLVVDYTEQKTADLLSRTCKCLSTVAFLCIPCVIGQSRDVTGNYDGLLQVTSCLFVLCAVVCYFLPKFRIEGNKLRCDGY